MTAKTKRRPKSSTIQPLRLVASIGVCLAAGLIGSLATAPAINTWYRYLHRPALSPPNWLFAPVWTTLYILMGISLYLAWRRRARLTWFWLQLALNTTWSLVFFGLRSPGLALLNIAALWFSIAAAIKDFRRKSLPAAWLLIPYLAWVTFAAYLNFAILILN